MGRKKNQLRKIRTSKKHRLFDWDQGLCVHLFSASNSDWIIAKFNSIVQQMCGLGEDNSTIREGERERETTMIDDACSTSEQN